MSKHEICRAMLMGVEGFIDAEVPKRNFQRLRRKNPERETISEKCATNPDHLLKEDEPFCRLCGNNNPNFVTTLGLYDGVCQRLHGVEINIRKSIKLLENSDDEKKKAKRTESVDYWTTLRDAQLLEKHRLAQELAKMQSDERNAN